jgi:zinc D-Ala-D-Ala dipeptidase
VAIFPSTNRCRVRLAGPLRLCCRDQRRADGSANRSGGDAETRSRRARQARSTIKLDIRYATTNNFTGKQVYSEARAFLQRPAARALVAAHRELAREGYGLLIHDGYRPWTITKLFWEVTPPSLHEFVADPAIGSKHNRGCAVDLTLYDLKTGRTVEMPSAYDEMTPRAYPDYAEGPADARARRDLLRTVMERHDFTVEPNEWWHFNFKDWKEYPILDIPFSAIH